MFSKSELAVIGLVKDAIQKRKKDGDTIIEEFVLDEVKKYSDLLKLENIDPEKLKNKIWEDENITHTTTGIILGEDNNHYNSWFDDKMKDENNYHWNIYREYIENEFNPSSIYEIELTSKQILNACADPSSKLQSNRLGMLIGDVQSGKTANIAAITSRALDSGYKFIIILTSNSKDLRDQTQERIDEAIIGESTNPFMFKNFDYKKVGIGLSPNYDETKDIKPGTNRHGDFTVNAGKSLSPKLVKGGQIIFVIKKNTSTLSNFLNWYQDSGVKSPKDSLMIIDDEADYASVNYNEQEPETDPTKINSLIRQIIHPSLFNKSTYIAVTATPFANVFINANLEQRSTGEEPIDYGSDIFPKHFIKMSISPSNHLGPNNLFDERHPEDNNYPSHFNEAHKRENVMPNAPLENRMLRLLPRSRDLKARDYIDDEELLKDREGLDWQHPECFPYGQKELIERLPESLMYAVRVFILSLAINNIERKNEHHNMIVNVSVNQTRQREVAALIHDYKRQISDDLFINAKMDETKSTFLSQLQKDYIKEFSNSEFDWSEIKDSMQDSIKNVDVIVVNSEGQEIIYEDPSNENFKPTIKIIVGGHKLSRGITIKGLAVSYIARRANAADTLLQIGRFFGYRNETRHITRIFLTEDVYEYYQEINRTLEELRVFIRTMNLSEYDPKEFGIRIRDCFGINLTSKQKQRSVDHITVTSNLAGKRISAHSIRHENQYNEKNRELFIKILKEIKPNHQQKDDSFFISTGFHLYNNIDQALIRKITKNFNLSELSHQLSSIDGNTPIIENFFDRINELKKDDSYEKWDLVIASPKTKKLDKDLSEKTNLEIKQNERAKQEPHDGNSKSDYVKSIRLGGRKNEISIAKDFCTGIEKAKLEDKGLLNNKTLKAPTLEDLKDLRKSSPCIIFYDIELIKDVSDHLDNPILTYAVFLPDIDGLPDSQFQPTRYSINTTLDNIATED